MLRKGVMPMPPARKTAGRAAFWLRIKEPKGPTIRTSVPSGMVLRTRLNAVSRMRVAIIKSGSPGALAIEKFRIPPSAAISGRSIRVQAESKVQVEVGITHGLPFAFAASADGAARVSEKDHSQRESPPSARDKAGAKGLVDPVESSPALRPASLKNPRGRLPPETASANTPNAACACSE